MKHPQVSYASPPLAVVTAVIGVATIRMSGPLSSCFPCVKFLNRIFLFSKNKQELERLEGIIQKNIGAFYEVGKALMEIRNQDLYKLKNGGAYQTFEAYCKGEWDYRRAHAYRLIGSAQVVDECLQSETFIPSPNSRSAPSPVSPPKIRS